MKKTAVIKVRDRQYRVYELTVGQVWILWGGEGPLEAGMAVYRIIEMCTGVDIDRLYKFKEEEILALYGGIQKVNESFFKMPDESGERKKVDDGKALDSLERMIDDLIVAGHGQDVWEYGWARFERAHQHLVDHKQDEVKSEAIANRMAYHADAKDFTKFMRLGRNAEANSGKALARNLRAGKKARKARSRGAA